MVALLETLQSRGYRLVVPPGTAESDQAEPTLPLRFLGATPGLRHTTEPASGHGQAKVEQEAAGQDQAGPRSVHLVLLRDSPGLPQLF